MSGRIRRALRAARGGPVGDRRSITVTAPFVLGLLAGAGALVAWAGYQAASRLAAVLVILVAALLIAVGAHQLVLLLRRAGMAPGLAVTLIVVAGSTVAVLAVALFIPFFVNEFAGLARQLADSLAQLRDTQPGRRLDADYDLSAALRKVFTPERVADLAAGVFGGISTAIGLGFAFFTAAALTIYLIAGFERLTGTVVRAVPASRRPRAAAIVAQVVDRVGAYLVGVVAVAICAGVTSLLFMLLVGIPYALALALVIAAFDVIPQIGATLGALVVIVVALSQSFGVAVGAAAFFIVYQQIENWLVYPRVMRRAVHVSGLAAVFSVLVGTVIAGIFGALIAVPLYAALSILVHELYLPRQDAR
jgi:predicted PurR-regulated permease PerM